MGENTLLESVVSGESVIRQQWLPLDIAADAIVAFEHRFGASAVQLACHAALPWIVNPELVNLIRINFLDSLDLPWIADADFLLSALCRPIGGGCFEVDPRVREVLLVELEDTCGSGRLTELAEFLHGYTATPMAAAQPPGTTRMQRWIALAYLAPEQLVSEMTATLHDSLTTTGAERQMAGQLQIAMTSEIVADPLAQSLLPDDYRDLLTGSRTIAYYWYGDQREALRRGLPAAPATASSGAEMSEGAKHLALFIDWARVTSPEQSDEAPSAPSVDPIGPQSGDPQQSPMDRDEPRDAAPVSLVPAGSFSELEISIARSRLERYSVDLRLVAAEHGADVDIRSDRLDIGIDELRPLAADAAAYGRRLGQDLFAVPEIRDIFARVQALEDPLRIRLAIDPNAQELHEIRWEALRDPATDAAVLVNERVLFSRYVNIPGWRQTPRRAKRDLQALVVVANPIDLNRFAPNGRMLSAIDVASEIERARGSLSSIAVTTLGHDDRASLDNIVARLMSGPDIVYLVCHAAIVDGEPRLWLEDDAGETVVTSETELVTRLREVARPPRLVMLISVQAAGQDAGIAHADALGALGPALGAAGIPAVLAMPASISIESAARFVPVVIRELQQDGQIDRAVAVARGEIRDRLDAWAPVLYMRLRSGRLWYIPGFTRDRSGPGFEKWLALLKSIEAGLCTPVLGPGLAEPLVGTRREIAMRWAERHQFPMRADDRENLARVAQFVAVNQDPAFLVDELIALYRQGALRHLGDAAPPELQNASLDALLVEVGKRRWDAQSDEPHRVLAELPFPLFVTTAFDSLIAEALRSAGKEPRVELFQWNEHADWPPRVFDLEPDYYPTAEQPLVYHLFGHLSVPGSLVITDDDYMDYLIGATRNNDLIPTTIRRALADTALLFLGFDPNGEDFRALFRSIMNQRGQPRRKRYAHVMQQDSLEEGSVAKVEQARQYLESYFRDADIHIYWGSVEDFARDLRHQMMAIL